MVDRRAIFFLLAAVVCALLAIPTQANLRWVPIGLAVVYVLMAAASYLDFRSRLRRTSGPDRHPPGPTPG